ncbi:MAG: hypothetical protein PHY47_14565 [Lachnospiraceae bacterium]|nr:hypothetical protein [Lachnospiraceae bacterium]
MTGNANWFEACCIVKDDLWIAPANYNFFYRLSLKNNKIEECFFYPGERSYEVRLFCRIFSSGPKLFLLPAAANEILIFDYESKIFRSIEIEKKHDANGKQVNPNFYQSYDMGTFAILISPTYPDVIYLDYRSETITYSKRIITYLEMNKIALHSIYASNYINNKFLLMIKGIKGILCCDYKMENIRIYNYEKEEYQFFNPCFDGKNVWTISPKGFGSSFSRHNIEDNRVDHFQIMKTDIELCESYIGSAYIDGNIYFFPSRLDSHIIKIDINTKNIDYDFGEYEPRVGCSFSLMQELNNEILLYEVNENALWFISKDTKIIRKIFLDNCENLHLESAKEHDMYRRLPVIREQNKYNLQDFLLLLAEVKK